MTHPGLFGGHGVDILKRHISIVGSTLSCPDVKQPMDSDGKF